MKNLTHPKETLYFTLMLVVSVLIYSLAIISIVGIFYLIFFIVMALFVNGLFIGHLKGNAVLVTDKQFPDLFKKAEEVAKKLEIKTLPEIYILESGGILNALAIRFLRRHFVVLYTEVLEMAYEKGEDVVEFILAHEMTHVKKNHVFWAQFLVVGSFVPFLSQAYSRACEYTCDHYATYLQPRGAVSGLLALASGKELYHRVDPQEFASQALTRRGFWVWLAEKLATHPHLTHRLVEAQQYQQLAQS
jgi:Zn-dependent protease with chaperone function